MKKKWNCRWWGGGKKVTIKDNFETPQTNTQEAKDYLINYQQYSAKYPKAELLSYIYHSGFIETSYYSKYYFDENANLTNILKNKVDYKFWGMLPQDTKTALYYKENNGQFSVYEKALTYDYEKELIKSKNIVESNDLYKELFTEATGIRYDTFKINTPQTNTKDANDWKKQLTNTYHKSGISEYAFDNNGNLTSSVPKYDIKDIYTFWGATNDGKLYGLYYQYNGAFYMKTIFYIYLSTNKTPIMIGKPPFFDIKYKTNIITNIYTTSYSKADELMLPVMNTYNYTSMKISTTTAENNEWKSKVAGKTIEEKDVMNTYTFLPNGDISVKTSEGKDYTLHFWGAKDSTNGIYYVKINLRDIFGNIAPNEETYFYYGYEFDNPILEEYQQCPTYHDLFRNWRKNNFDNNGNPKNNNIDWASMPLQTTTNIYWEKGFHARDEIYLREK